MHLARGVTDDDGRSVIGFGLVDCLERLRRCGSKRDLSNIDVAVAHRHLGQALLLDVFARGRKLRHLADVRSFRCLTAGVRIDLRVENEDIDVMPACKHVVKAAVADVVGPSVAAEDPEALLGEEAFIFEQLERSAAFLFLESCD